MKGGTSWSRYRGRGGEGEFDDFDGLLGEDGLRTRSKIGLINAAISHALRRRLPYSRTDSVSGGQYGFTNASKPPQFAHARTLTRSTAAITALGRM
jgi:hypothetical protein